MAIKDDNQFTELGMFNISSNRQVFGELCVSGSNSYLHLADKDLLSIDGMNEQCVTGTLHDLTKVTLIQCITTNNCITNVQKESHHSLHVFPHFVVRGDGYLAINNHNIQSVTLYIEDSSTLFNDFDAFGSLHDARPYIKDIVEAKKLGRVIPIGDHPHIAYFTGKNEIVSTKTVFGRITANHNLSWNLGGPSGVHIDNNISVTIKPDKPITFRNATDQTLVLLRFFELIIGRPQHLKKHNITVRDHTSFKESLRVYWSLQLGFNQTLEKEKGEVHPSDVLIDPIRHPNEFTNVLTKWLEKDSEYKDSRNRFSTCFGGGDSYTIDRLVGAANMFDILPLSAVPKDVELSPKLISAKAQCKDIFKPLSHSLERDSILGALGRLGKSSLKHKVRHRASYIVGLVDDVFPNLFLVTDEAINCRNHYVHGSPLKTDYRSNIVIMSFLVDTLEFVFAASDLVESGWDIKKWSKKGTSMTHPFGRYLINYKKKIAALEKLLK